MLRHYILHDNFVVSCNKRLCGCPYVCQKQKKNYNSYFDTCSGSCCRVCRNDVALTLTHVLVASVGFVGMIHKFYVSAGRGSEREPSLVLNCKKIMTKNRFFKTFDMS